MRITLFYTYLRRQIPVMIFLSLVPGLAYVFIGYIFDLLYPALIWYLTSSAASLWGYYLYRKFNEAAMSKDEKLSWYRDISNFFYLFFSLWAIIFLLYVSHHEAGIHYIAIFTELGASVVAATLLFPDKRLFIPILAILMLPLTIYLFIIGLWYTYLLAVFSVIFLGVLYYASFSSYRLIHQTSYQANHDQLTDLFNRHSSINLLQESINALKSTNDASYILLIDLDHFKIVNDTLGHDIGDLLLQEVAQRMKKRLQQDHYIARLGGDEFIIINHTPDNEASVLDKAINISKELLHDLRQPYEIEKHQLYISASIGISMIKDQHRDAHEFIKEADIAMYEVKSSGKDNVFVFDHKLSQKIQRQLELEKLLPIALQNREFYLNFQPQMSLDGRIIGCESLLRWDNETYGNVLPNEFIPIAEQTTYIVKLGYFVMEEAFKTLQSWHTQGIKLEQFSINLSVKQLFSKTFIEDVLHLSQNYLGETLNKKVIFEITESMAIEDMSQLIATINTLKQYGFRFSLDDFGTGYSSLSYLREIPIDELKIDKSFIDKLQNSDQDIAMIQTIFNIAKSFNFTIVAEGVEQQKQLSLLQEHKCDIIQGYLFSKPLSQEAFLDFYNDLKD